MSWIPDFELGIWNAWIFMIWQVIFPFLLILVIKDKSVIKRLSASVPMKFEKISNAFSMIVLIISFLFSIFIPLKFDSIWFYIGLAIFLFGLIINLTTFYTFRKAKTNRPFTTGPYRYSRHPVYFSFALMYFSMTLMSLSWVILIFTIIFTIEVGIGAPVEEHYCLEKYGKEYKDYMDRTPRWIGIPSNVR